MPGRVVALLRGSGGVALEHLPGSAKILARVVNCSTYYIEQESKSFSQWPVRGLFCAFWGIWATLFGSPNDHKYHPNEIQEQVQKDATVYRTSCKAKISR